MMAANEAAKDGDGGISRVSRACGPSRVTMTKGIESRRRTRSRPDDRRTGRGRHSSWTHSELPRVLETLVEPSARGDPQSRCAGPARAPRTLAAELARQPSGQP